MLNVLELVQRRAKRQRQSNKLLEFQVLVFHTFSYPFCLCCMSNTTEHKCAKKYLIAENTGKLRTEHQCPLQLPSVVVRLTQAVQTRKRAGKRFHRKLSVGCFHSLVHSIKKEQQLSFERQTEIATSASEVILMGKTENIGLHPIKDP